MEAFLVAKQSGVGIASPVVLLGGKLTAAGAGCTCGGNG